MAGRYWISGVQLGILKAILKDENNAHANGLLEEIENKQFMGNKNDKIMIIEDKEFEERTCNQSKSD